MSYEAETEAIETRFKTNWVSGSPAVAISPIQFETLPAPARAHSPWVRLTIVNGEGRQKSLGAPSNNTFRYVGVVMISVFVPLDVTLSVPATSARSRANALVDQAANIFRGVTFDGILCQTPYVSARRNEPPWYHVTLVAPFTRDSQQ